MKNIKISLIFILIYLMIISVAGASVTFSNDGGGKWQYYRELTLTNYGDTLTDYQMLVNLSGASFPTTTSNGADIRFIDINGNEINYWIENWDSAGRNANVWVEISSIPARSTTNIRMFYGNPKAASNSNGESVFIFFDNFETGNYNKWTTLAGNWEVIREDGHDNYIVKTIDFVQSDAILSRDIGLSKNIILEGKVKRVSVTNNDDPSLVIRLSDVNNYYFAGHNSFQKWFSIGKRTYSSYYTELINISGRLPDLEWHSLYLRISDSNLQGGIDGSYISISDTSLINGNKIGLRVFGDIAFFDNIRVRKYVSLEPAIITYGAEQPVTGNISITSIPSGAEVLVDRVSRGTASPDLIVSKIATGNHIVECRLSGYSDYNTSVTVKADDVELVTCQLNVLGTPTAAPTTTPTPTQTPEKLLMVSVASKPEQVETGASSIIEVIVTGQDGAPVSESIVKLSTTNGIVTPNSGITDSSGQFISTFKGSDEGIANVIAQVSKDGAQETDNVNINVTSSIIDSNLMILVLIILILAGISIFVWTRENLKIVPEKKSIPADGKSTVPIKVQFENVFKKPKKQKKDREVKLESTSGKIQDVIIKEGQESVNAILTSSNECAEVTITARSGSQKASAKIDFEF